MKEKKWIWRLFSTFFFISIFWADTNTKHFLGLHAGITTGTGLCYRQYVGKSFSWQISFFPMVQEEKGANTSHVRFISIGTFDQFFLHFTQLNTQGFTGTLFLWTGAHASYQYTFFLPSDLQANEQYTIALGGGPGFEIIFYNHFIFTLAGGYSAKWTSPSLFAMNFTGEISCGYRF